MCGIAGIIYKKNNDGIIDEINSMLDTIVHRGPDGLGTEIFEKKIALGHRRLSIIDLSDAGHQPMSFQDKYYITFNGEIYNYVELKKELCESGITFKTETDTEVILAAYEKWGEKCVTHFNGMWAFALYDKTKKKIFCSRDRFGVKPFYYSCSKERIAFASEIKELFCVKGIMPVANRKRLMAFLASGVQETDNTTFFENIYQLNPGTNLLIDTETLNIAISGWYDLLTVKQKNHSLQEDYCEFKQKFLNSIKLRLRADVPIGSCLSGGLDSSAIVCAVHEELKKDKKHKGTQCTVSSCFEDKNYDEQEYIDAVTRHTGVKSYKIYPDMDNVFSKLDEIVWHMDEPFVGTSMYAQWCVFEEAKKQGLTVMLDGQGADEQLAGYTPFYRVLFVDLLKHGRVVRFFRELKAYKKIRSHTEIVSTKEVIVSALMSLVFPDKIRYYLNKIYRGKSSGKPYADEFYDSEYVKRGYMLYDKRHPQKYIHASMTDGLKSLLHYEDRNSMAHSVESRVPFLDKDLVEFVFSVPINHKIVDGKTKNILREGLKEILPSEIYYRYSKLGFVTPEDKWIRDNQDFFRHEVERACDILKAFVDKNRVMKWYDTHVEQTKRGDNTCFRLICAAHWVQVYKVQL